MRKGILLAVMLLAVFGGVQHARGDEIAELRKQIADMQRRLDQLEASQKQQSQTIEKKVSEQVSKAVDKEKIEALPESMRWVENIKLSGDFRYRHESIDAEDSHDWATGHNRHRIRARLGIDAKVNDEFDLGFRIASGSGDPASTNQTLADSFSSKALWLDLAYFNYHPLAIDALTLFGGKMKNPFYKVGKNELIWDGDVNPEGIAAKYVIPLGERNKLHVSAGGFWVDEDSAGVDTSLWGAQTYLKHEFKDKRYLLAGASYFDYGNIKGRGDLKSTWTSSGSFFGNTATGSVFDSDYDLIEGFAEYGFKVRNLPVAVFGNYVKNTVANTSGDEGWLVGLRLNKAKKPGSWDFRYNYREVEADAVLGAFSDSDFIGGGTDGKGHEFGLTYQLHKNTQLALTYFHNERDRSGINDADYRRLQFDIKFKF
jgi:hypothetical protein